MGPSAATQQGLTPTTEVDVILATHGWWPWPCCTLLIIGVLGAAIIYFLRQHRAKKASANTTSTATAEVTPAAPSAATQAPPSRADPDA